MILKKSNRAELINIKLKPNKQLYIQHIRCIRAISDLKLMGAKQFVDQLVANPNIALSLKVNSTILKDFTDEMHRVGLTWVKIQTEVE